VEWSFLNKHLSKETYLREMLDTTSAGRNITGIKLYIPLKFWFCNNTGSALPLISLQYHDVEFKFTFRGVKEIINTNYNVTSHTISDNPTISFYTDYIYLDENERKRFSHIKHEYLIQTLQTIEKSLVISTQLQLSKPISQLIWTIQDNTCGTAATTGSTLDTTANLSGSTMSNNNDYLNYMCSSSGSTEIIGNQRSHEHFDTAGLLLDGIDRFQKRNASYFRLIQPLQSYGNSTLKHIYLYSFALNNTKFQPSGTCNFSKFDKAKLILENPRSTTGSTIYVYATNYNVLRIQNGMGGVVFD